MTVTEANPDLATLRRRLILMGALVGLCAIVALASVVGELRFHIAWMRWLFILALLVGFGAQIWLIIGFVRQKTPDGGRGQP